MTANPNGQFRADELVHRNVKVGNEWQTRIFPIIGGRLRILHENNDHLSIHTEIVRLEPDFVVVRAAVESQRGKFSGTGTAASQRDARLADSLVELAETRAIARALRFGGIGVEYTGAEEVSHVAPAEPEREQSANKPPERVFPQGNGESKPEAKPAGNGNGRVTQAQCRALYALTRKAQYTQADIDGMLSSMGAVSFEDLTRETASKLISSLQIEIAA
jgi:hypothetical protein